MCMNSATGFVIPSIKEMGIDTLLMMAEVEPALVVDVEC